MSIRSIALAALIAMAALPASAQDERAQFRVSVSGVPAATLVYEVTRDGAAYRVRGAARPSGLLGMVVDESADTVAQGRVTTGGYAPSFAQETTGSGDDRETKTLRYSSGTPSVTRDPPRDEPYDHAADPNGQAGTIDTTTAMWAILRDRPAAEACRIDLAIYDGRRRHRVELTDRRATDSGLVCEGTYTRVAGWDPDDIDRRTWPVTMTYADTGGVMQVQSLSFPTNFGNARLTRQ